MEFGSEGVESEEVSKLPSEGVLGEGSEWKECVVDCWKGLRIGSTPKHLWNWEAVRVQRMLKVSEVRAGKTLRQLWSRKQVVP